MRRVLATDWGKQLYLKRQGSVEPVFGQIKSNRGANRFLRRGRSAVRSEWRLLAAAHNLQKLHRLQPAVVGCAHALRRIESSTTRAAFSLRSRGQHVYCLSGDMRDRVRAVCGDRDPGTDGGSLAGGAGNGQATAEGLNAVGETAQTAPVF
jgi:hypothetical protein